MRDWGSQSWYSLRVQVVVVTALTLFRMMLEKPESFPGWWQKIYGRFEVLWEGTSHRALFVSSVGSAMQIHWCLHSSEVWGGVAEKCLCGCRKQVVFYFVKMDGGCPWMHAPLVHTPSSVWVFLHTDSSAQKWKAGMQRPWPKVCESQQGSTFLQEHELCFLLEDLTYHRLTEAVQKEWKKRSLCRWGEWCCCRKSVQTEPGLQPTTSARTSIFPLSKKE